MADGHPTHLPALDAYTDLEDIDNAAAALSLIVAAFLDDDMLPLDALYTSLEPCRLVLARHDDLHTMVKECHARRNFDAVRNQGALQRHKYSLRLAADLAELPPAIIEFLQEGGLQTWSLSPEMDVDDEVHAHIASLGMPSVVYHGPSVLLRDLGRFSDNEILANRVKNIFVEGQHTFLVNTSGSGKTRLTFEGLCQHWGFYLVGAVDGNGIGSTDLKELLEDKIPYRGNSFQKSPSADDPRTAAENVKITHRCLRQLLLCRLLVFSEFAEHIHTIGVKPEHKKLWLQMQALPSTVPNDPLGDIFSRLLLPVSRSAENYTEDYIAYLLAKLRGLFGDDFHLFVVIDEAQVIFRYLTQAYRDDNGACYPVLREIIDGLYNEFHQHEISFVIAGTEIPKAGFQHSPNSVRQRWCSDTGTFENKEVHCDYVARYLPPSYVATTAGKAFLQLVWDWCRGRYRATDTLMATLARDGFRSPHTLLNDYVETATGFRPTSNLEFTHTENQNEREPIHILRIDCGVLEYPVYGSLTSALRNVLFHYSVTGQHPQPFGVDHIVLVDSAFGRFIDGRMSQIVVDEPLMLVAAARWFCTRHVDGLSSRETLLDVVQGYPPTSRQVLSTSLVIYITHAFAQGQRVSEVFSFPYSPPKWAKQTADVVALHQPDGKAAQYKTVDLSTPTLATSSTSLEDTVSWLSHRRSDSPPFIISPIGNPDLICVLRLAEGTFLRVVLHVSTSALRDAKLVEVMKSMEDDKLFSVAGQQDADMHERAIAALQTLPPRASTAGRPSILRVVASFPAPAQLKSATNKSTRGVARLNTGLFKTLAAAIPASAVFDAMVEMVTSGKRKRVPMEFSEKRKRQKIPQPVIRRSGRAVK